MEHVDIPAGEIHQPHNFTYADSSARAAAVITDAGLIGKLALQSSDGTYWRLTGVGPAVWSWVGFRNEAGQIKANYSPAMTVVGLVAAVPKTFNIVTFTSTLSTSPTTTYPFSAPTKTYADMFDATRGTGPVGRLIENPIGGQFHKWRIQGSYANKTSVQTGYLKIRIRNPVSGFIYEDFVPIVDGVTTDSFNLVLYTIADSASIPSPNGYILDAIASFSDVDLTISITSLTRSSEAIGYGVI